jgi:hypothetical protein
MRAVLALGAVWLSLQGPGAIGAVLQGGRVISAELVPARVDRARVASVQLRFALSDSARVVVAFDRQVVGNKVGSACVPARPEFRGYPSCRFYITLNRVVIAEPAAGPHKVALARLVQSGVLAPGAYRVRVRATKQTVEIRLGLTVL